MILVVARGGLWRLAQGTAPRIESLHSAETRLAGQRAEFEKLSARRVEIDRSLRTLRSLRGQGSVDALVAALDAAVDDGIWLREMKFERTHSIDDGTPEERHVGYMVIVPPTPKPGQQAQAVAALRQLEHLELHGLAVSHRGLVEFLQRLGEQPGVRDVRLVRTSPAPRSGDGHVDFDVIVLIDPVLGGAS